MRPAVQTRKTHMMVEILADGERLKAMPKADRPGQASMAQVYETVQHCLETLEDSGGNVAQVQACPLPTAHLEEQAGSTTT